MVAPGRAERGENPRPGRAGRASPAEGLPAATAAGGLGAARGAVPYRPTARGRPLGPLRGGSLEALRGGRLRSAAAAREVAPADFGKRLHLAARLRVGSAR